jgi:hypothetical protein
VIFVLFDCIIGDCCFVLFIYLQRTQDNIANEDASEESSNYDPQSVTVPITLCLAIMVG